MILGRTIYVQRDNSNHVDYYKVIDEFLENGSTYYLCQEEGSTGVYKISPNDILGIKEREEEVSERPSFLKRIFFAYV